MNLLIRLKRITLVFFVALVLTCLGLGLPTTAFGGSSVIYSFAGDEDGEYADTDLTIDKAGNLYGTTVLGGDFGSGTVFQLSPSGNGWIHTFSIALRVAQMEANHTKVSLSMPRAICMARRLQVALVAARVDAA